MESQTFGRYQIKAELGRGGMAIVYHAFDPRFNRNVALKILPREFLFDQNFRARFDREAQAIASLEHSAIAPVYDFGEEDGQPFFVMRFMPGGSLADLIRQRQLSLDEIQAILARIASALDFAHQKGVIHRDVKPANILFDEAGDPYLADFGIVKLTEASAQLTGKGMVGTPSYMAPEMMDSNSTSPLIDVYALGVTLFQMLTARLPYNADTPMGIFMAHINKPIPIIHDLRHDLPEGLQAIIESALAKSPADRYPSASALAEDLALVLRDSRSDPISPWEGENPRSGRGGESPPVQAEPVPHSAPTPIAEPTPQESASHLATPPDALTVDVPLEPTVSTEAITHPPIAPASARKTPNLVLLGGGLLVTVILAGILVVAGVFSREAATDDQQSAAEMPTAAPTAAPAATPIPLGFVSNPVTANDLWTPQTHTFGGVEMALVPAGCFMMGSENGGSDAQPVHEQCFEEPFYIDVYEVTNEQYGSANETCLKWSSGDDQPRICVDWFQAVEHCESREARLLTEAEWEYAARGPDGLVYPWGNDFEADNTVYWENSGDQTAPVGSRPGGVSWVGAYDMIGNVLEWVSSIYTDYPYDAADGRETDGSSDSSSGRVLRGGPSCFHDEFQMDAACRSWLDPIASVDSGGFRCARSF